MELNLLYFIIFLNKLEQKMITNCTYMFRNECDTMNVPQR